MLNAQRKKTIQNKMLRDWMALFFILFVLFLIKNLVLRVNFNPEEISVDANTFIAASSPYRIHINLDEQQLYVYYEDALVKTYPVSGGKKATPSPTGDWIVVQKAKWGDGYGGAWLGLNVPWGTYGIHGTRAPWAIGRENISGGCIRLNNDDAKELYEYIPYGTKVSIVFENQPFRNLKEGDLGSDVYRVQKALKQLGYYSAWCSGKYGAGTKSAVMLYQQDMGLAQTGRVNISTWNKLMQQAEESLLE